METTKDLNSTLTNSNSPISKAPPGFTSANTDYPVPKHKVISDNDLVNFNRKLNKLAKEKWIPMGDINMVVMPNLENKEFKIVYAIRLEKYQ